MHDLTCLMSLYLEDDVHGYQMCMMPTLLRCRWGYWGYGDTYGRPENASAYTATLDSDMTFWDTGPILPFLLLHNNHTAISASA